MSEREDLQEQLSRVQRALTPSAETQAAYSGAFSFIVAGRCVYVPWETMKKIMAEIRFRAGCPQDHK